MHSELLKTAQRWVSPNDGSTPSDGDLRRVVSTAYYALFHYISRSCADELTAGDVNQLSRAATQIYRSLDHRDIVVACEKARMPSFGFPKDLRRFADIFLGLQKSRHKADYDPLSVFTRQQVEQKVRDAEAAIARHAAAARHDRRAFAILVAVKAPPRNRG